MQKYVYYTMSNVDQVSEPTLLLPKEYYAKPRNDSAIQAVEKFYRDVAIELGANSSVAADDARNVIDFEIELSKVSCCQSPRKKII